MKKNLFFCVFLLSAMSMIADKNVTSIYIENPDYEARFAGWINNGFSYVTNSSFSQKHGKIYMERWVASGGKIPNVEISQDLYLPAGTYMLTAGCQNIQQSGRIETCTGAILYANDEKVTVTESKDYSITFTVLQGVSRIGKINNEQLIINNEADAVFDLSGRKVNVQCSTFNGLKKGIYIRNGKKVLY